MKQRLKFISFTLGAVFTIAPISNAFAATDINANIPSSGDNYEGLVFIDPSIRPLVQPGQTVSFGETKGFYRTDPYLDPNEKKTEVWWYHPNSSWVNDPGYPMSKVSFGLATALFEDGSGRKGFFYTYNIDHLNSNNGYPLVSVADIPAWVSALGGNQKYIDVNLDESSYMKDPALDTWNVASLSQLANKSGAYLEAYGATSPTDLSASASSVNTGVDTVATDSTAWPTFKIFPTPAPTTSVTTDKQSYSQGDTVTITATSNDYTPFTGYHDEAVYVTGPNGYKKFLNITSGANGTVSAAGETDTQFPYWGPNDTTVKPVYGGGSGDAKNPTVYNDTATLDTAGLAQGMYTVHFVMYDSIGRMSTSGTNGEVTAEFTVGPAKESIKLSPPSETVQSGQSVNLSYTVTGMQPGDTVKVTPSGTGVGMWQVSGDTKATDSTTETEASTTNPINVSYTATVYDKNGKAVASDSTTITWNPSPTSPLSPKDNTPSLYEKPVTQPLDYGVNLTDWLWNHWPRMGDTGKVNVKLINLSYNTIYDKDGNKETIGGYLDYSISATSDNPYFKGFTKNGEVFATPPSGIDSGSLQPTVINLPVQYTVAQRQDPRKGYFIKFTVKAWSVDKTIPGKPPTDIPALPDSDSNNDTAILNMWIPSAPVLTR